MQIKRNKLSDWNFNYFQFKGDHKILINEERKTKNKLSIYFGDNFCLDN